MSGTLSQLGLVLVLVLVNAAFAGSEIAILTLREGQLQRMRERGLPGRIVARLAEQPTQFLATIQIGITLAGFLASATAAVSLSEEVVPYLAALGRAAEPVAILLVTLVLTFVTLVVGELSPKRLAMQRAEPWALAAAIPLAGVALFARPAVWLLSKATDLLVRLAGGDPTARRDVITQEELEDLITSRVWFSPAQQRIIEGAIEGGERTLREILVPRVDVVAFPASMPASDAIGRFVASGHTRAPVYEGEAGLDGVTGVVHVLDLLDSDRPLREFIRPVATLPESARVIEALRQMQRERQRMAVVASEHGGVEGIVTTEDLVEELVGEIFDEFDRNLISVVREPSGAMLLDGGYPIHDLVDVGVELPEGEYATVGGLVMDQLGRIPEPGDRFVLNGWDVEVLRMDGLAVDQVRVRRATPEEPSEARAV
ncbi:MAG: HlyC/CorC family transporter [Dehalococcoidia bacterium]|nr:HlyC/CorC family transporter [Dehalococcoidia bacterium]